jgi:hypothetical protein
MKHRAGHLATRLRREERRSGRVSRDPERIQRMSRDELIDHMLKLLPTVPLGHPLRTWGELVLKRPQPQTDDHRVALEAAKRAYDRWRQEDGRRPQGTPRTGGSYERIAGSRRR